MGCPLKVAVNDRLLETCYPLPLSGTDFGCCCNHKYGLVFFVKKWCFYLAIITVGEISQKQTHNRHIYTTNLSCQAIYALLFHSSVGMQLDPQCKAEALTSRCHRNHECKYIAAGSSHFSSPPTPSRLVPKAVAPNTPLPPIMPPLLHTCYCPSQKWHSYIQVALQVGKLA